MLKWELEDLVNEYARLNAGYLYPHLLARIFNTTPSNVVRKLLAIADDGKLKLQWQVSCPNCQKITEVSSTKPENFKCGCGKWVGINSSTLVPVFSVSEKYKTHIANKGNGRTLFQRKAERP